MNHPPQKPQVDADISPRVPRDSEMTQEYEELKEPDSGGGLVNMISKGIGLFFGRQSDVKGSQSEN